MTKTKLIKKQEPQVVATVLDKIAAASEAAADRLTDFAAMLHDFADREDVDMNAWKKDNSDKIHFLSSNIKQIEDRVVKILDSAKRGMQ